MAQQAANQDQTAKPIDPFLTPEQQQALAELLAGYDRDLNDIGYNYAQQAANVTKDAGDIIGGNWRDVVAPDGSHYREYTGGGSLSNSGTLWARGAAQQQTNNNALIARGLGQSSIRDTDLGDIETATTLARNNMLASLSQLAARNESTRGQIRSARDTAQINYNKLAVQNAQGIEPTPGSTRVEAPSIAPAPIPTPQVRLPKVSGSVVGRVQAVPTPKPRRAAAPRLTPLPTGKSKNAVKVGKSFNGGARAR